MPIGRLAVPGYYGHDGGRGKRFTTEARRNQSRTYLVPMLQRGNAYGTVRIRKCSTRKNATRNLCIPADRGNETKGKQCAGFRALGAQEKGTVHALVPRLGLLSPVKSSPHFYLAPALRTLVSWWQ